MVGLCKYMYTCTGMCMYRDFLSISPPPLGFTTPGLASLLYDMGPQCASCNQQAIHEVLRRYQFGSMLSPSDDTTLISRPPLIEAEVDQLIEVST